MPVIEVGPLNDLFHKTPTPMWVYDLETLQFLDVNQAAIDLYGWSRDEFLKMSILDIRPEEDSRQVNISAREHGIKQYTGPWRHFHKDGTPHLVRLTSYDIEHNSRPARVVMVIDITESVRATESLRMSEAELRAITDRLPVALLYIDAEGHCRRINRTFEDWFTISREEAVQKDFDFFIYRGNGKEYEEAVRHAWKQALSGQPAGFEKTILVHGKRREVEATYTPDFDAAGNVCGVIVLLHDITEHRALEEQFRHAQKMEAIGRLAGGIAHDFNNILSVINGYAHLLKQELKENNRLESMVSEIHRASESASRLIQQLLAFGRKQDNEPRLVCLDDLLYEDETILRRLVGDDVRIDIQRESLGALVEIDPNHISQILLNLAVNARDAMPHGGVLTIRTSVEGNHLIVSVHDTGCGMTPEVKERLFEPFFTTKKEGKGTGLGLATVYGLIHEAAGNIHVESTEGTGSTFILSLPLAGKL